MSTYRYMLGLIGLFFAPMSFAAQGLSPNIGGGGAADLPLDAVTSDPNTSAGFISSFMQKASSILALKRPSRVSDVRVLRRLSLAENPQVGDTSAIGLALQRLAGGQRSLELGALRQLVDSVALQQGSHVQSIQSRASVAPMTMTSTGRFMSMVAGRLYQKRAQLIVPHNRLLMDKNGSLRASEINGVYDVHPLESVMGLGSQADQSLGFWGKGYGLVGNRKTQAETLGYGYEIWGGALDVTTK